MANSNVDIENESKLKCDKCASEERTRRYGIWLVTQASKDGTLLEATNKTRNICSQCRNEIRRDSSKAALLALSVSAAFFLLAVGFISLPFWQQPANDPGAVVRTRLSSADRTAVDATPGLLMAVIPFVSILISLTLIRFSSMKLFSFLFPGYLAAYRCHASADDEEKYGVGHLSRPAFYWLPIAIVCPPLFMAVYAPKKIFWISALCGSFLVIWILVVPLRISLHPLLNFLFLAGPAASILAIFWFLRLWQITIKDG